MRYLILFLLFLPSASSAKALISHEPAQEHQQIYKVVAALSFEEDQAFSRHSGSPFEAGTMGEFAASNAPQEKSAGVLVEELIHELQARQKDCDGEGAVRKSKGFFCEDKHQK